ncbi:MAG TPA: hypothetical protein VLA97_06255 [Nocardioidaceae bacterium]|nr:hypothetical protein [Nocardioidaceae bacterium]
MATHQARHTAAVARAPAHDRAPGRRAAAALVAVGAVCGLAWAAGLRGMMAEIAGPGSEVDWSTFTWILLPGTVMGALLGWAEHLRRTGGRRGWRWLALSPLLFAAVLFSRPTEMGAVLEDGIGAGTVAVPLLCMAGGYALSGRGPLWSRSVCGLLALSAVPAWAFSATLVGGPGLALDTPRGAWVALLYYSFLAVLAVACAIPHRPVVRTDRR